MIHVYLGRGSERRRLELGRLLGEGAAGKVHALPGMPQVAAKLYHGGSEARHHEAKIDAMIANPPDLPPALHHQASYPQIAWPQAKLFDVSGRFIGFTMPEIDFGRSTSLVNLLQKNSRRIEKLSDYYGYRVLVARNLASVFAELHRAGHHMIDMKPANLRFYPVVSWMAVVDTDGFSIAGRSGRIAADQLSDEYIAPESWKRPVSELGIEQDQFALAVIIFQLLDNGVHPFSGGAADGVAQPTDLQARIMGGLYPYALRPSAAVMPSAASIHRMFRRGTRVMFDCAFLPGGRRPTAEEWRDHLDGLLGQLVPCAAKPDEHVHFGAGCGFCGHEARIAAAKVAARTPVRRHRVGAARPLPAAPAAPSRLPVARPAPRPARTRVPYRPPARRGIGGWGAMVALLLLGGAGYATRETWRPLLPSATAHTAELTLPAPEPTPKIAAFPEPVSYLILPAEGSLSVPLRSGPGTTYPIVDQLGLHDLVYGKGTRRDAKGATWTWVTRDSDGESGFVMQAALLQRSAAPGDLGAAEKTACVDPDGCGLGPDVAPNAPLEARYRQLLAGADGYDRAYLAEGQRLWREQRQRCGQDPDPATCRKTADAVRLGDLQGWADAEKLTRHDDTAAPELLPASLSTTR
ncbi:MAG: hypothetical protein WDN44_13660 [Sphingomonas sp.]